MTTALIKDYRQIIYVEIEQTNIQYSTNKTRHGVSTPRGFNLRSLGLYWLFLNTFDFAFTLQNVKKKKF